MGRQIEIRATQITLSAMLDSNSYVVQESQSLNVLNSIYRYVFFVRNGKCTEYLVTRFLKLSHVNDC